MRDLLALLLLFVLAFCGFGFLATYEPPGAPGLRIAYACAGAASFAYIARVVAGKLRRKRPARAEDDRG